MHRCSSKTGGERRTECEVTGKLGLLGALLRYVQILQDTTQPTNQKKERSKRLPGTLGKLEHEALVMERSLLQLGPGCAHAPSLEQGPVHVSDGVCLCVCVCTYINQLRPPYLSLLRSSKICQNLSVTPG